MSVLADIVGRQGHPVQRLTLNVGADYQFEAGQYLSVKGRDTDIPLSIASSPTRLPELELHYRSTPGAPEAAEMDRLLAGSRLELSAAAGSVRCAATDKPLLLIAGGSGAAQAFSCAEYRATLPAADTFVLWCADQSADVYDTERLSALVRGRFQVCIDDRRTPQNEGLLWLQKHAVEHLASHVIICGSPGFVYTVTDLLLAQGFAMAALQSDVYAYAPRTEDTRQSSD